MIDEIKKMKSQRSLEGKMNVEAHTHARMSKTQDVNATMEKRGRLMW